MLVLLSLSLFVPGNGARYSAAGVLFAGVIVLSCLLKKRRILSIYKGQVAFLVAVTAVLYLTLYYLSGFAFGFYYSENGLSLESVLIYVIPITFIIVSVEIIRYVLLSQEGKAVEVLVYITSVIAEVLIYTGLSGRLVFKSFLDLVGMTILPALVANLVFNYLSSRYGPYPCIAYRLVTTLYSYFIWFVPATPDALYSLSRLLVPLFILWFVDTLYERKRGYASRRRSIFSYVSAAVAVLLMISSVMLISCRFSHGVIVIATESMTGEINKGDAVIYESYGGAPISVGQVIVFDKNGAMIVHRVIKIERINGENRYYTKGDANDGADEGYVVESDIVGTVAARLPCVGYPTVWLNEAFK